jgi:hypothetical protein
VDDKASPDLRVGEIAVWTLGRLPSPTPDPWWVDEIVCRVEVGGGITAELNGQIPSRNLASFVEDLERCYDTLAGRAQLDGSDMGFVLELQMTARGHVEIETRLFSPGKWYGELSAQSDVDQSYLPPLVAACRRILERFPVRATRDLL